MAGGYDKYECTICLEDFNKPKLLPCAHTFCEDCLTDHIKAHATKKKFTCPVCRKSTDVPALGAREFPNNFYLAVEEDELFCPKHKKMKLKFYCRDCSEVVCRDCVVVKHKNHKVDDLATVEEENKPQLKPLTEQLEEKVAELKMLSDSLKLTVTHINTTTDTACQNVDKQTEIMCDKLREQAQEIKMDILKIQDNSNKTVHKMMKDINRLITQIETCVNCSHAILTGKTTSKSAVDILPNIHTLIESGRKTSVDLPEVRYPLFRLVDIDTQCLRKLLGIIETENEASLSYSFNAMEKKKRDDYYSGLPWFVNGLFRYIDLVCGRFCSNFFIIHGLAWYVYIERDAPDLNVFLVLYSRGDWFYSCTADVTLKLVNKTDDSQSVVEKREGREFNRMFRFHQLSIDWKKLTDPRNGFLQDNRFTIVATVKVTKIRRQ